MIATIFVTEDEIRTRAALDDESTRTRDITHWRTLAVLVARDKIRDEGWDETGISVAEFHEDPGWAICKVVLLCDAPTLNEPYPHAESCDCPSRGVS